MATDVGRILVLFTDEERGWGQGWHIVWVRNDEVPFGLVKFEVLARDNIQQFFMSSGRSLSPEVTIRDTMFL